MSTQRTLVDEHPTHPCACCGTTYTEDELVRLLCHDDIALCGACIDWLSSRRSELVRAVPVLYTDDVAASQAFWQDAGFNVDRYDDGFAAATRDGLELHLATPDPDGRDRGEAYIHARDVDAMHRAWKAAGLPVSEIRDQPWGMREFNVTDPGGNRIRIGRSI